MSHVTWLDFSVPGTVFICSHFTFFPLAAISPPLFFLPPSPSTFHSLPQSSLGTTAKPIEILADSEDERDTNNNNNNNSTFSSSLSSILSDTSVKTVTEDPYAGYVVV